VFLTICAITAVIILILVVCIKAQIITYQGDSRLILSIFELINGEDISNGRSALYAVAWELFLENPLFGIGFGNFRIYGSQIIGSVTNVHNIYLQLLCELGIFGAIIIFIAMALLLRCLYINFKKSKKRKNYSHSYFSLFMFVYILIVGLFDNPIFQDTFWLLLFLIIACSFKTKKIKHKKAVN
jgi:O-antigen ligase